MSDCTNSTRRPIFAAMGSFWRRLVAFFGCCWVGHYVGVNAGTAGPFFRSIWQLGPRAILDQEQFNPILVPLSWFWTVISGCSYPLGLLQLFILATAFLIVRLSEDRYYHGFGIILLTQPIHSFLVEGGPQNGVDLSVTLVILVTWETGVGALYWWFCRQTE